jgi:hypothetical protein
MEASKMQGIQDMYNDWKQAKEGSADEAYYEKVFVEAVCDESGVESLPEPLRSVVRTQKMEQLEHAYKEWTQVLYKMTEVPVDHLVATQLLMMPQLNVKQERYLHLHQQLFCRDYE